MRRYALLCEGGFAEHDAKTAVGVLRYAPDPTVAVIDSTRAGTRAGEHVPGLRADVPVVATLDEAVGLGATVLLIGIAPAGGKLPDAWRRTLLDAMAAGLDVESGLHTLLADDPELAGAASAADVALRDLRRAPAGLDVPTGANLEVDAHVVGTVGTDCALGKMTLCLELDRAARDRGLASVFVPTGQTGIAIAGWGIAVDEVVSDFVAGAAERLVLEGRERGGPGALLWIEGQGSVNHPAYSGVTLGLLHGSAPHSLLLVHEPGRDRIDAEVSLPIPPLSDLIETYERVAGYVREARVVGIALKTNRLDEAAAREAVAAAQDETGLPADDPVRFGADRLLDAVLVERDSIRTGA
jgi:D-glutamate N-acetyltransferase